IDCDQRVSVPVNRLEHSMSGLETQYWRTRRPTAELHPDVPAHRDFAGCRGWAQLIDGRLRRCEGIRMDPDEGDTSGDDRRANERDEHRATLSGRLIRLVLFEDVDEAEVEVLADRGCWGLGWIGLRGHPLLRRAFAN